MHKLNLPDTLTISGAEWEIEKVHVNPGVEVDNYGWSGGESLKIKLQLTGYKLWDFHSLLEEILHAGERADGVFFGEDEKQAHARLKQTAMYIARVLVENDLVKI